MQTEQILTMSTAGARLPYLDVTSPVAQRALDLVSRMTLAEKLSQLGSGAPAIERLGLTAEAMGSECIHGVGRAGRATVFPQALGLASTWDVDLMTRVATAISDELRAKYHHARRDGPSNHGPGLSCWSPNINLFRDPRWGRGQETYGEDPYLTARFGVAFIRAMQGDHPRYLKSACAVKHFAVHSGPDAIRHQFDIHVTDKDLWETYLPHFEAASIEGQAAGVMGAYNRLNGEHCCASPTLLQSILRERWGFEGFVVSDGGALHDLHDGHRLTRDEAESAALALRHGCDFCLGHEHLELPAALERGLITEADVDRSLLRLMTLRLRLGLLDPAKSVPYAAIPIDVVECPAHRALAREAAGASIVLLKNENQTLPLPSDLRSITLVGPNASDVEALLGNYNGFSARMVTPLEGITAAVNHEARIHYVRGCDVTGDNRDMIAMATSYAKRAQVIVAVLGLSPMVEGEEYDAPLAEWIGDRLDLDLPGAQEPLLKALVATGRPVVLVLTGCAPLTVNWAMEHCAAIVNMGYAGEEGGTALADVLWGAVNPSGRLPVTWPKSVKQLPPFHDYAMANRTYRYMTDEPLFPFGYGLSYTTFAYDNLRLSREQCAPQQDLRVEVTVTNTGSRAGDEVVQLYLQHTQAPFIVPLRQLAGFRKVHLKPGESKRVELLTKPEQLLLIDRKGHALFVPGNVTVSVGGSQPDALSQRLMNRKVVEAKLTLAHHP